MGCMCAGESSKDGEYKNQVAHPHGGDACGTIFKTGYDPEKGGIIYCEKCYQQEVY
jgi:hypothetical protein